MTQRSGWLFPLMVVAAGSVTAFGCIGLAAITGHLALTRSSANPLGDFPGAPAAIIEQTVTPQPQADSQPVAVVVVDQAGQAAKPAAGAQPGKNVATPKTPTEQTLN